MSITPRVMERPLDRIDGAQKVTGTARYAFEQPVTDPVYVFPVLSTIARGRVTAVDTERAGGLRGVVAVLTQENAPRLSAQDDAELAVLQSDAVAFRGQLVAAVVAETPEVAREAAGLVRIEYEEEPHDTVLRRGADGLYAPEHVNPSQETDTADGDVEGALASAAVTLDETYTTATYHNNPLEPHASIASWDGGQVTLYESTQGAHWARATVARVFGLDRDQVRVISPHVGGGFGSKAFAHAPIILAVLASQVAGRPAKLALTRQQMFTLVGYRTPTIQRLQLAADADGRLTAVAHDVVEQTARVKEFAEQTAVPTRTMYAAPNRRTTHRLARLDVPPPTIMRAPGECPGMFALESAMDEMAAACGLDPIEFRVRNEPERDPATGKPFSSRGLIACLREGARRFGWGERDPAPRARREEGWLVGTGVAASTYPVLRARTPSRAAIHLQPDGRCRVRVGAADIGTGTWTALTQVAADALGVDADAVDLEIGDTDLPEAPAAGGSWGITSWGSAIVDAARNLRAKLEDDCGGTIPAEGLDAAGELRPNPATEEFAMHSYGAQFAEVRVHERTGEIRVPRLLGVFAAGRIVNAKTGRSQLLGGMTMGLSMALHEATAMDGNLGHFANHDLAEYHIATHADVGSVEATWIDEDDPHVNPMGSKGIGELGIVGTAAAIANAAHHATGVRVRNLPISVDHFVS